MAELVEGADEEVCLLPDTEREISEADKAEAEKVLAEKRKQAEGNGSFFFKHIQVTSSLNMVEFNMEDLWLMLKQQLNNFTNSFVWKAVYFLTKTEVRFYLSEFYMCINVKGEK